MEICRLCLLRHDQYISVYTEYQYDKNVAAIIGKHVGEVSDSDPLPKHVCLGCWRKIDNFHEFHKEVQAAQANYLKGLIKCEQENNFFTIPEPVHVNVDTAITESIDDELTDIKIEYDICKNGPPSPALISCEDEIDMESQDDGNTLEETEASENHSFENSEEENEDSDEEFIEETGKVFEKTVQKRIQKRYEYTYICDFCQRTLTSKNRLLEHLMRHIRYKCKICSERCQTQRELELHSKTIHGKDAAEKAKKQLAALEPIIELNPTVQEIDAMLAKHADHLCDYCKKPIKPTFDAANAHYDKKHGVEGYLKCCELRFKTMDDISSHVLTHLYEKHFTCSVCGKIGKRKEKFRRHVSAHLNDIMNYPYLCSLCNQRFPRDDLLEVHMRYLHDTGAGGDNSKHKLADFFNMQCDLCETVFETFKDAKKHYKRTHNVTGYIKCCNKKFIKVKTVDNHFQWHINPESIKCEVCGKCFKQKVSYYTHLSRHKSKNMKPFQCSECEKTFSSKYYMKLHIRVHDEKAKKALQCPECDKRYTSQKTLDSHILFVHKNEPKAGEMCEFCGRRFISRSSVLSHIQTVHRTEAGLEDLDNPAVRSHCNICSASFINKYRLKKHVETVHNGQPVKCSQCDKVAPNLAALNCHIRSVHVAQSFQCHLCPKTFKAAVALKDHIATHTGEKTYKCAFCPEAFIWRPNMYSHQKKAHPEEWSVLKGKDRKRVQV